MHILNDEWYLKKKKEKQYNIGIFESLLNDSYSIAVSCAFIPTEKNE